MLRVLWFFSFELCVVLWYVAFIFYFLNLHRMLLGVTSLQSEFLRVMVNFWNINGHRFKSRFLYS